MYSHRGKFWERSMRFMSGDIFRDTISIERLRHYAEDAKKSKKEILAITQPEYKINMIADAVAIKEN